MKSTLLAVSLFSTTSHVLATNENFDSFSAGKPPSGWFCGVTGGGTPHWTVGTDISAPNHPKVLKQSGIADFPWCVKENVRVSNGAEEMRFKPV